MRKQKRKASFHYKTNSTSHLCWRNFLQRLATSGNMAKYSSVSRNAASGEMRAGASLIALQSGSSNSAGLLQFFIQFLRSVFQNYLTPTGIIPVQIICFAQTNEVIHVFFNAAGMAEFYGVAFQSHQMPERNDSNVACLWKRDRTKVVFDATARARRR